MSLVVRQRKQIAVADLPEPYASIFDRGPVAGGHQRLQAWQIGEKGILPFQRVQALRLKVLKSGDRVRKIPTQILCDLVFKLMANNQETSECGTRDDQGHGSDEQHAGPNAFVLAHARYSCLKRSPSE